MTIKRLNFDSPYGCRWCGDEQHHHGHQWAVIIGMHPWMEPDQAMVLERMKRRRAARLAVLPLVFHATTAWADDGSGESADPYCADCKTPVCHRWSRIQARLDEIRWGIPRRARNARKTAGGGWGSQQPF